MQLIVVKRRLADIKAILDKNDPDGKTAGVVLIKADEYDQLVKKTNEAIEAAEKISLGHHAIAEVLNRI